VSGPKGIIEFASLNRERVNRVTPSPHKILIVAPSWIGDTLIAQPLLTRLKQQHPAARIEVLAPSWSAPLLARMAEVDAVIDNPFAHGEFNFAKRRALGRQLAATGYDHSYVLPNSWKSALLPFFARIPVRIGYHGEARWGLLTQRHRLDESAHPQLVQRYAALAGPLPALLSDLPRPRLSSTPEQQRAVRHALGLPENVRPLVLCPGAEFGPAKRWPIEHFAALARQVSAGETAIGEARAGESGPIPVWIVSSAKDKDVGDEIARLSGGAALNLCGRSSLAQAVDLIASARAVVSNDSGLMHVAAALDRPMVALYGSSSPEYTPPCSPQARILTRRLPCSPCFKRECPLGHFDCLKGISAEQVRTELSGLS
jgi:heptosyltransferase II